VYSIFYLEIPVLNGNIFKSLNIPVDARGSFPGLKRPGREADSSPPSSAGVKELVELYFHFPNTPSWRGAQLKK
jgi:hypothetical protein